MFKRTAIIIGIVIAVCGMVQADGLYPLTTSEKADKGATHVFTFEHSDLTESATNTAQALTFNVAAKMGVEVVAAELAEAFTDSATNAFDSVAVKVGDGTDDDMFLTSTEVNSYGTEVWLKYGRALSNKVYTATDTIDITVTPCATYALEDLDAGEMKIYFRIRDAR